jgi:hypothetical protein
MAAKTIREYFEDTDLVEKYMQRDGAEAPTQREAPLDLETLPLASEVMVMLDRREGKWKIASSFKIAQAELEKFTQMSLSYLPLTVTFFGHSFRCSIVQMQGSVDINLHDGRETRRPHEVSIEGYEGAA